MKREAYKGALAPFVNPSILCKISHCRNINGNVINVNCTALDLNGDWGKIDRDNVARKIEQSINDTLMVAYGGRKMSKLVQVDRHAEVADDSESEQHKHEDKSIERVVRDAVVNYNELFPCAPNTDCEREIRERARAANKWLLSHGFEEEPFIYGWR